MFIKTISQTKYIIHCGKLLALLLFLTQFWPGSAISQTARANNEFRKIDDSLEFINIKLGTELFKLRKKLGLEGSPKEAMPGVDFYLISNPHYSKIDTFESFLGSAFFRNNKLSAIYLYSIDFSYGEYFTSLSKHFTSKFGNPIISEEGHMAWEGRNVVLKLYNTKKRKDTTLGTSLIVFERKSDMPKKISAIDQILKNGESAYLDVPLDKSKIRFRANVLSSFAYNFLVKFPERFDSLQCINESCIYKVGDEKLGIVYTMMMHQYKNVEYNESDLSLEDSNNYSSFLEINRSILRSKEYIIVKDTLQNLYLDNRLAIRYTCNYKAKFLNSEVDCFFVKVDVTKRNLIYTFLLEMPQKTTQTLFNDAIAKFDRLLLSFRFYQ